MLTVSRRTPVGFTLIEVMIALAILMVLLAIALPSFVAWIKNTQIRTAAEGVKNGLVNAKTEAIRTNMAVAFTLRSPGAVGGTGWTITFVRNGNQVAEKPDREGSATATLTTSPGGSTTVTFSGLGRRLPANPDGTPVMEQVDIGSTAGDRPLRIAIPVGGDIRMCDPSVSDTGDPRAC